MVVMMIVVGGVFEDVPMLGTTLPTEGTGLAIRGDIEGMLASCESRVTPAAVTDKA